MNVEEKQSNQEIKKFAYPISKIHNMHEKRAR